ncbi:MAG: hypothetical protein MUD08_00780 [Cytophagales bacterium]|nr:hypothetical protein [Cytophagales bacterium]
MRLFVLFLFAVTSLAVLPSCQEQRITFEGPHHVRFTDTVASYRESYPRVVVLRVHNVGPQLAQPITISYLVSGTAREGIDYNIVGTRGTVTIPANQSFGEIQLRLRNNANDRLESQQVVLTMVGATPDNLRVGFGKNNNIGRKLTLTILDDCILGGYYIGTRRQNATTITVPDVRITSTDCNEFTVSNWNIGLANLFNFQAEKPTIRFIDKKDNTIEIPEQSNSMFNSSIIFSGDGAWNPQNGHLSLNIRLRAPLRNPTRDTVIFLPTLTYIPERN